MTTTTNTASKYLDLNKFTMFLPVPGVENQRAKLVWGMVNKNPRLSVLAFNKDTNRVEAAGAYLGTESFLIFCDLFEQMIDADPGSKNKIECYTSVRNENGGTTGEKRVQSEVWFGVDQEGFVWISVVDGDKPRYKFNFFVWEYHKFLKADGTALEGPEASRTIARVTIKALREVYMANMFEFTAYGNKTANSGSMTGPVSSQNKSGVFEDINF